MCDLSDPSEESESDDSDTEEEYQDTARGYIPPPPSPAEAEIEIQAVVDEIASQQRFDAVVARTFPTLPVDLIPMVTTDPPAELIDPRNQVQQSIGQDSTLAQQTYSLNRWTAGFIALGSFGGIASAAAAIYAVLRSQNNATGPVVPPGTNTPLISSLLAQWTDLSEQNFWAALSTYVDVYAGTETALSLTDQYQFMTYVIDLWPLTTFWEWEGSDALAARDFFLAQYATSGNDTSAMYRAVPGYTYQGDPMPRAVAATIMQYALAKLIVTTSARAVGRLAGS
ncbi:MAG TPA: hypothetical protein VER96_04790 [Polyangiaceae bacterium]|nr:hypothetical protein [Polyangiaceae bacterium]